MKRWSSPFQVCFNLTGCKTPTVTCFLVRRESKEAENVAFDVFYVFSDSADCALNIWYVHGRSIAIWMDIANMGEAMVESRNTL